jgi:hypothetical protein
VDQTPAFSATFGDGLVEQVIALVQLQQGDAINSFGPTQFTGVNGNLLDPIVDFHKGPIASPNFPCLTVTAGTPAMAPDGLENVAEYHIKLTLWLDLNYLDPEQLADWQLKYFTMFFRMWAWATDKFSDLSVFTTGASITWPGGTAPRTTAPPASGTVKSLLLTWDPPGVIASDKDSGLPVKVRLAFGLTFHMMEV